MLQYIVCFKILDGDKYLRGLTQLLVALNFLSHSIP